MSRHTRVRTDAAAVTAWLTAALSALLAVEPDSVSAADALDDLALDSLDRLRLLGDLSDEVGTELEAELLYECATVADLATVAAERAARVRGAAAPPPPALAVAASFTIEPVAEALEHLLAEAGTPMSLAFCPYDQILQSLLDPASALRTAGPGGAAAVLWRLGDWFRHGGGPAPDQLARALDELDAGLAHLPGSGILAVCPERERVDWIDAEVDAWLSQLTRRRPALRILDLRGAEEIAFDPMRESVGHIPYTPEGFVALALALARTLHTQQIPAAKVIVLDADNTLWSGVVGEDGPAGVRVSEPYAALQRFMAEQRAAGRLLALASKNAERDVAELFASREDMELAWGDFSARRVNWSPKSENVRAIAAELGLGADALVFVDDSPLEIAEVRAGAPEVLTVQLPADPEEIPGFLAAHWAFDRSGAVTEEDRRRPEMMAQNAARDQLAARSDGLEAFLAALELTVSITPIGAPELARAAQLTQRTNQFNATTVRHDETSLAQWLEAPGHAGLAVCVADRFGDYGFVGLMLLTHDDANITVESFMLSCRVLGRRVEHQMLSAVCDRAAQVDTPTVTLRFSVSDRNAPLRAFYGAVGVPEDTGARVWPVAELRDALHHAEAPSPVASAGAADSADRSAGARSATTSISAVERAEGLARIARRELSADGPVAELTRELAARITPRPDTLGRYIAPQSAWERRLCGLWAGALRLDRIGVHDDFYDLGGTSLDLAELTVQMAEAGVPDHLALGTLPEQTVAALAAAMSGQNGPSRPGLVEDARLPAEMTFTPAPPQAPARVLLTGATGYVGAFALAGLLSRTVAHVDCHVRAADAPAGAERIRANLSRYGLWREEFGARITARPGDLAAPRLGLPDAVWQELAAECDTIVHNGATVNFLHPYARLRDANVGGTITALALANDTRPKAFHLISTLGVLMSGGYGDRVLSEDDPLDCCEDLPNGYEQSKWVADRLVREAMDRGLSGAIHRLGMLSGLMSSGVYHKVDEFLPSFLKGCIQLGAFPDLRTRIEMVPVDFVCDVLSAVIADPDGLGRAYQMNHPAALPAAEFVATIRDYGYPLRLVSWDGWKRELLSLGRGLRANALAPYADFVRALAEEQTYMPEMELTNFLDAVAREAVSCPSQDALLTRYLDYFVSVGFLPAPVREGVSEVAA